MLSVAAYGRGVSRSWLALWLVLLALIAWYVVEALSYAATRELQPGATTLNRQIWYVTHVAMALPILLIAPLQFLPTLRGQHPVLHRQLGRAFLTMSMVAGAMAVWLGATIQYQGSRIPLVIFGLVWIGFSAAAWLCAVKRDYVSHRKFVIRSFAIGLAFVWVRILGDVDGTLFSFISNDEVRDSTSEFLSFVLPLLVTETWLTWAPALRSALKRQ